MISRQLAILPVMILLACTLTLGAAQEIPTSPLPPSQDTAPSTAITPPRTNGILELVTLPTVKIECVKNMGNFQRRGSGSGTILNSRYILTANHVISGAEEIYAYILPTNTRVPCKVVCTGDQEALDYAIIEMDLNMNGQAGALVPSREIETFEVDHFAELISESNFENLATGDKLYAAGYPLGGEIHLTTGLLCAFVSDFYTTSALVTFGNSGGGIYNENYQLIGVLVRVAVAQGVPVEHISFMVPINSIREHIKSIGKEFIWTGEAAPVLPSTPRDEESQDENQDAEGEYMSILNIGPYETIRISDIFKIR